MLPEAHWLHTDYRTLFRLRNDGRIERENDPDCSPGPRFWLAGCGDGNIFGMRADLPDDLVAELERLAAAEPPLIHPAKPKHLADYLSVFDEGGSVAHNFGLIYRLPHALRYDSDARLIGSDSEEGQDLMQSWAANGVPENLFGLGFRQVADFWAPWCAAAIDGQIASIAFAARLSDVGAELGLATAKAFRGRGLARPRLPVGRSFLRCVHALCSTAPTGKTSPRNASPNASAFSCMEPACGFHRSIAKRPLAGVLNKMCFADWREVFYDWLQAAIPQGSAWLRQEN
ncbi:hypothetical protein ACVDG5_016650 [Mesorhizobium sp. ORM6]